MNNFIEQTTKNIPRARCGAWYTAWDATWLVTTDREVYAMRDTVWDTWDATRFVCGEVYTRYRGEHE